MLRVFTTGTLLAAALFVNAALGAIPEKIAFNAHIRPILSNKCFACHGFDAKKRQADLRLDTFEGATSDANGTKAIEPGKPDESELWRRITSTDPDEVMPPPDSHKDLTADEKSLLKAWIEQGAAYQKHWAFEAPVRAEPPQVEAAVGRIYNPIDAFIGARLQREGLAMSAEADKETLIRRVAFALTGFPPTPAEVDAYLSDSSADAYEKMVDRYLASKHYGEEMARHWLDVARYADTHGLHLDNERQMWAYRDWVINAFNRNQKFDEFTIEQLAGDQLPNPSQDQLVATGFNRCNVTTSEGGSINEEFIFRYAVDRASTTAETWMGLTAGCAVCHDHKFDPISAKEFYSLYAFFNSAADPAMDGNVLLTQPVLKLETPEMKSRLAAIDGQLAAKQQELDQLAAAIKYTDPATLSPPPPATDLEQVLMDDEFPAGAKVAASPGHPPTLVSAPEGQVFSGKLALKRADDKLAQDVWGPTDANRFEVPQSGKLFAYVYLDPAKLPSAIMLQYHTDGWKHRAVWGEYDAIPWGTPKTTERVHMGPLPEAGKWVRLEVSAEAIGLKPGAMITGFATTQYGGVVYWDKLGISGVSSPATDVRKSFRAWWANATGKDTPGISPDLNQVAKNGPDKGAKPEDEKRLLAYYLQSVCVDTKPQFDSIAPEMAKLRSEREAIDKSAPSTFIFKDLPKPRDSFVMIRGAYDKPGEKVEPGVPAILPPLAKADPNARATRLDLAKWLVSPEHPLAARVTVNRFWQQFFGTGLVKTSFDFGSQGEVPSHPELLDWLSISFRENWDVKALVKLMLTSATFRQSSRVTPDLYNRDPENRLYARGPRFRLDAEQIRDNALFVSGLANLEMGGKGVKTYQPPNIWEPVGFVGSNTRFYKQDSGPDLYRRSIYTFFKRTAPPPFMVNFDAPNREQFCTRRDRSNTPLQALQTMNDVQHIEAARAFAERMVTEGGTTPEDRITFAYRSTLSRKPESEEMAIVREELDAHLARYQQDAEAAKKLISHGESKPKPELNPSELAAYTMVANMILNLDETLTRN